MNVHFNSFNWDEVFVDLGLKTKSFILINYLLFRVNINDSPSLSFYKNNEC